MNQVQFLLQQTKEAYDWVNKLVIPIPAEKWADIPPTLDTSINWQVGHLILSFYYHSILVIKGHQMEVIQQVPLQAYDALFAQAAPSLSADNPTPTDLLKHLAIVQHKSLEIIGSLAEEELAEALLPTGFPHPIAKTKSEALDWNVKHCMWHCGQIGMLRRIVYERYDFGLKK